MMRMRGEGWKVRWGGRKVMVGRWRKRRKRRKVKFDLVDQRESKVIRAC